MQTVEQVFSSLGVPLPSGGDLASHNPADGTLLGRVHTADRGTCDATLLAAQRGFLHWRTVPAPVRGALIRELLTQLRTHKVALGTLISLEVGKIRSEGLGEVQEMVDICELAVGLSRQLGGLTLPSERAQHRMMEQWHPLGPVGVVTAFNFPMAVWSWNAALAVVCGNPVVWKPSPQAPLCALAVHALCQRAMAAVGAQDVFHLVQGGTEPATWLADDARVPLLSFTGSTAAGRQVAARVAQRLGRSLLELGGNNAVLVMPDADLDLAVRAITFGAVGTAGQRCTSTRRLLVHRDLCDALTQRLVAAYGTVRVGHPLEEGVLMGPLISARAVGAFQAAVAEALTQGGRVLCGGAALEGPGHHVQPTIILAPQDAPFPIMAEETFAPILFVRTVADLEDAILQNNAVAHGLSSALFTDSLRASERFLSAAGSDCGIANVNLGTSGAEIGGAFGGEKDTGGGREAGSDAWKAYMRRQTTTVNHGRELPLAQGVRFL